MLTGSEVFSISEEDANYYFIKNGKYEQFWKFIKFRFHLDLSESFKKLFVKMTSFINEKKFTIEQILNDEWFEEINKLSENEINILEEELKEEFIKIELEPKEVEEENNDVPEFISDYLKNESK